MGVIAWIIIGLVAGWLANVILGGRGGGLLHNLAVGLVGAIVGGFLFAKLISRIRFLGTDHRHHRRGDLLLIWRRSRVHPPPSSPRSGDP